MDYEKIYNEALERAKGILELVEEDKAEITKEDIETIFPELAESEDERIRHALIEFLREAYSRGNAPEECAKWIVWLDQQKDQKEELVYRLNGLMQEYIKEGKDEAEKEHRFKCYRLFWDALEDANFFEQKEQKPVEWSEEDEEMLDSVIHIITHVDYLAHEPTFAGPKWTHPYSKEIRFLNKLRNRLRNRLFEEND